MAPQTQTALSIGNLAANILDRGQYGKIVGQTSKGLFIKTETRWLLFISTDHYPGPLTINIPADTLPAKRIEANSIVSFTSDSILIHSIETCISSKGCQIWVPPALPIPTNPAKRSKNLCLAAQHVLSKTHQAGISSCLYQLIDLKEPRPTHSPTNNSIKLDIKAIQAALQETLTLSDTGQFIELLSRLLGLGSGLTPTGDDFILGFLLCLNRWQNAKIPNDILVSLNHQIVENAYRKTTRLSANLIECATLGLADERLIRALDGLMSAEPTTTKYLDAMMSWGNSSGTDAFVGFVTALLL